MSELSFLIELLFNFKMLKPAKDQIVNRIKEIENRQNPVRLSQQQIAQLPTAQVLNQANTQAGAQALQDRQQAIDQAMAGKGTGKYKGQPK